MLRKPSKYILNLNLNQFSRGQKLNQGILCMFIGSFYCYTNIWTQRKNKIGGQHTQDVEKSDNLLGKHQFSKYYQCQSYRKNCYTPVFFGFFTLHLCDILSKIDRGIPPDNFEVYYLSVGQNLEPIFMFAFEG